MVDLTHQISLQHGCKSRQQALPTGAGAVPLMDDLLLTVP